MRAAPPERGAEVQRAAKKWRIPVRTIYRWITDLEAAGGDANALANGTLPPSDWRLRKERHQLEFFFNEIKCFHRISLGCEKTLTASAGFVHLACHDLDTTNADSA